MEFIPATSSTRARREVSRAGRASPTRRFANRRKKESFPRDRQLSFLDISLIRGSRFDDTPSTSADAFPARFRPASARATPRRRPRGWMIDVERSRVASRRVASAHEGARARPTRAVKRRPPDDADDGDDDADDDARRRARRARDGTRTRTRTRTRARRAGAGERGRADARARTETRATMRDAAARRRERTGGDCWAPGSRRRRRG